VYGERDVIRDNYNAATIKLVKDDNRFYEMDVELRAYNEGAALRYWFPENQNGSYFHVAQENTEFSFPQDTKAFVAAWAQGPYNLLPLHNWQYESERPLTLQLPGNLYACITEAAMVDYARTKFTLSDTRPNTIVTAMYGEADLITPFGSPWRVVMVAEKPGELIEHDDIILNLNGPSKISNTAWIKPGKLVRVMKQTTQDAKDYIDFAAAHNLQYILFDWKWYGPAFTFSSDATKVVAPVDMPGVIAYAKQKGIGVWLYVNLQGLVAQMDTLFSVYKKWGIAGVKFGFVQVGSHRWTTWLEDAIKKAAENDMMVDIHDEFRPTGEQRTWPNFMTSEGVRGNEEMPDATHNTILPFTRFIAGGADYTICYYDKRIKTTHAHQLALAAVFYSPLQTVFWYDMPSAYHNEPEVEWFEKVHTVWDETKVIEGVPGEYITTARRSGDDWFIGTITNDSARARKLSFDFLPKGKKYRAVFYTDDTTVNTATHVRLDRRTVDASTTETISLLPSGGEAIWLTPVK
jgi:alpha-glucosidase